MVDGQLRRVHERHAVVTGRGEESLQRAQRQDLGARSGELPLVDHFEVGRLAVEQSADESTEDFGETHEGSNDVGHFARGDVDGVGDEVAGEGELHLFGDRDAGLVLGFKRRRAEVGNDDDRRQFEERRLGGGLLLEDVERGTLDVPIADGVGEVGFVDDAAAGDVDDAHARLGLRAATRRSRGWSSPCSSGGGS